MSQLTSLHMPVKADYLHTDFCKHVSFRRYMQICVWKTWGLKTGKNGTDYGLVLCTAFLWFQCTFVSVSKNNDPKKVELRKTRSEKHAKNVSVSTEYILTEQPFPRPFSRQTNLNTIEWHIQ